MLKVVGASWYKTKLSSVIILFALLLAFGALFLMNIERPHLDNVYCATAYWTPTTGYRVEFWGQGHSLQAIPKGVARVCYKGEPNAVDWPHMEIETSPAYKDQVQAFSAGILEGSLLWKSIYLQWSERIVVPCALGENKQFCPWLREVVAANYHHMKSQIHKRLNGHIDSYWYQIYLFVQQLEGIDFGWRYGLKRSPMKRSGLEIPIVDHMILNLGSDLKLLEDHYNSVVAPVSGWSRVSFASRPRRSIKLVLAQDAEQRISLSLDHLLHDSMKSPHRVLKKYKLNYRLSSGEQFSQVNAIVPGHEIILTSAPGVISSSDVFYAISGRHSRLTVAGVPINYGASSANQMDPRNFVFLSARTMAANRLATCSRNWAKLMKRDPAGVQQWVLLDRKVLHTYNLAIAERKQNEMVDASIDARQVVEAAGQKQPLVHGVAGLVWVVDNVPGRLHGEDVTARVIQSGKKELILEGVPHFPETLQVSGIDEWEEPQILEQMNEDLRHSVRFYVLSSNRSEYSEGLTVIHEEGGNHHDAGDAEETDKVHSDVGRGHAIEADEEDTGPSLLTADLSAKWTWV